MLKMKSSLLEMNAVLFIIVLAAHSLQVGSVRTFNLFSTAESAFDGAVERMTQVVNYFNTFIDSAVKRATDAVSAEIKKPFDAVYDKVSEMAEATNNTIKMQCVELQKKQADSDIDALILAGIHCITDIATDITNNTRDIVDAIFATKNAAASAAFAIKTCYTHGIFQVGPCIVKVTTAATVEALRQDVKAGIAITKLATLKGRIPANLTKCASQQAAAAAMKATKILAESSKCLL